MDIIVAALAFGLIVIIIYAASLNAKTRQVRNRLFRSQEELQKVEEKLAKLRTETASLREEVSRKTSRLQETRNQIRKRFRVQAQKSSSKNDNNNDMRQQEDRPQELQLALSAMEKQLSEVKKNAELAFKSEQLVLQKDFREKTLENKKEIQTLNQKIKRLEAIEKKVRDSSPLHDLAINVENLPIEVVNETGRLARKAIQFEKLQGVTRGKLQLAQERYHELQKRYFAVCRELALVLGNREHNTDSDVRNFAENYVNATEEPTSREKYPEKLEKSEVEVPKPAGHKNKS